MCPTRAWKVSPISFGVYFPPESIQRQSYMFYTWASLVRAQPMGSRMRSWNCIDSDGKRCLDLLGERLQFVLAINNKVHFHYHHNTLIVLWGPHRKQALRYMARQSPYHVLKRLGGISLGTQSEQWSTQTSCNYQHVIGFIANATPTFSKYCIVCQVTSMRWTWSW